MSMSPTDPRDLAALLAWQAAAGADEAMSEAPVDRYKAAANPPLTKPASAPPGPIAKPAAAKPPPPRARAPPTPQPPPAPGVPAARALPPPRHIELVAPAILVPVGGPATETLLHRGEGISKSHGRWYDYQTPGLAAPIPAMPMFHPAFLLRSPAQKRAAWRDLLNLEQKLGDLGIS